jgi:hypothetical protein
MSPFRTGLLKRFLFSTICLSFCAVAAAAAPTEIRSSNIIDIAGATQVNLGGKTFVDHGLQGMGRIAAGTPDFNGDTFGAFSGMDMLPGSWHKNADGTYGGTLFALPDRGPNGVGKVGFSDYAGRAISFAITFSPYTGAADLPAAATSQNQIAFTATGGIIFRDFKDAPTTGFDATGTTVEKGMQLPSPAAGTPGAGRISLDAEGLRFLKDGSFYVSDEYGANVYYFNSKGVMQGVILPPPALQPRDAQGNLSYTTQTDAVTGRRFNQGLEGVAITPDSKKLVTLLQTGTYQDTTKNQQDRTNTRLMIYDISKTRTPIKPVADYVLQLPIYNANGNGAPNRTAAQSELLALNDTQFLVLSRDGNGLGTANLNPVYKSILLVDTTGATNIAGTTYETTYTPLSPGGVLSATIKPMQQVELVNMLNATQLTKFGENLDNITPTRLTLGEKWEGMTLVSALDEKAPNDYFLFVGNDNDFLATNCKVDGQDCSQAVNSDAHVLVYRLTVPTVRK